MKTKQYKLNKYAKYLWRMFYMFIVPTISISMLPLSFAHAAQWTALPGASPSRPSLALNAATGKTQMVVRSASDQLYVGNFDSGGAFEGWNALSGASPSDVAQAWHPALNKMFMVARAANDQLYLGTFSSAGSFEGWSALSGASPSPVALAWHATLSKMFMVARAANDQLYLGTFSSAGSFEGWSALSGASPSPVALAWHPATSKMVMAVRGADDQLWQGAFGSTSGAFEGWSALSGSSPTAPVLATGQSSLQLVVRSADDQLWSLLVESLQAESLSPPANVALANTESQTVGGNAFSSSTQLTLSWTAPSGYTVDHYAISASESVGNTSLSYSVAASGTSATLTGLKSGTSYSVVVSACKDAACAEAGSAAAVSGTTSEEYWQLQGSGNSYTTLSTAVSDGSVLSWVMRWGSDAGAAYAGRYQYYYKTSTLGRDGVGVAATSGTGTDVSTLTSFSPLTTSGLLRSCSSAPGADTSTCATDGAFEISAIQAVPMTNGKIRAFFEAADVLDNNATRIYSLDSQDGLIGQDFHPGAQAYCGGTGSSDYAPGGSCALNLLVDVSSAPSASTPLSQSRQFKIGYDWNADWRWDGAAGTFMVITGDDNCNKYPNALFYATWDASQWVIAKDSSNCAKPIVPTAHGPVLVPLGGVAYKLYYEDQTNGTQSGKPLRLLYADGRSSGSSATVDFEDWESGTLARQVNFLWPDGSLLDAQDEAGLGDHMILTPTGSLDLQYMFLNRGGFDNSKWKASSAGLGIAVLLNP